MPQDYCITSIERFIALIGNARNTAISPSEKERLIAGLTDMIGVRIACIGYADKKAQFGNYKNALLELVGKINESYIKVYYSDKSEIAEAFRQLKNAIIAC